MQWFPSRLVVCMRDVWLQYVLICFTGVSVHILYPCMYRYTPLTKKLPKISTYDIEISQSLAYWGMVLFMVLSLFCFWYWLLLLQMLMQYFEIISFVHTLNRLIPKSVTIYLHILIVFIVSYRSNMLRIFWKIELYICYNW